MGKSLFGEILHGLGEITDAIGSELNDGKKTETTIGSLFHGLGNATDEFVDDLKNDDDEDEDDDDDDEVEDDDEDEDDEEDEDEDDEDEDDEDEDDDDEDEDDDDEEEDDDDDDENTNTVCLPVHVIKDRYGNIRSATSKFDDGTTYKFSKDEYSTIWYSEDDGKYYSNFTINNNENQQADEFVDSERAKIESLIDSSLPVCLNSLHYLKTTVKKADISDISVSSSSIGSFFKGTSGIEKVQKEAAIIFVRYKKLIDSYKLGMKTTSELISEFAEIRDSINNFYQECINDLKNLFGEKTICSIDPEIFDFKSVKFLDVDSMLKKTTLQYNTLNRKCKNLMKIVNESFSAKTEEAALTILETAITSSKKINSVSNQKELDAVYNTLLINGLECCVNIGSSIIEHYSSVRELTNKLKEDIEKLKNSFYHDLNNIQADEMRLFLIAKNLNDLFIPQANAFFNNVDNVMSEELRSLINQARVIQHVNELQQEKEQLNLQLITIKNTLETTKKSITTTNRKIQNVGNEYTISAREFGIVKRKGLFLTLYNLGVFTFISLFLVPKFLGTEFKSLYITIIKNFHSVSDLIVQTSTISKLIISIGGGILILIGLIISTKWCKKWKTTRSSFKNLQYDLYELYDNKTKLDNKINYNTQKQKTSLSRIKEITEEIEEVCIDTSIEQIKVNVASHLTNIIKLLKVAKSILENKLDSDLLNPVNFPAIQEISISSAALKKITLIQKESEKVVTEINKNIAKNNQEIISIEAQVTSSQQDPSLSQNELQLRNDKLDRQKKIQKSKFIKNTVVALTKIITSEISLRDSQIQGQLAKEKYDEAFQDLKNQFMNRLKGIDNQADVLNEALKNVNLANNHDDSLQALTELVQGTDIKITKQDIEDMLAGKKTITI